MVSIRPFYKLLFVGCSFLFVGLPIVVTAQQSAALAPDSLLPSIQLALSRYLGLWRSSWLQSEAQRNRGTTWDPTDRFQLKRQANGKALESRPFYGPDTGIFTQLYPERRIDNIHCGIARTDTEASKVSRTGEWPTRAWGMGWSVSSRVTAYKACPGWYQGPSPAVPWDERLEPDAPLLPMFRGAVQGARAELATVLARALRADSANNWLIGQHTRVLVDQGRFAGADSALAQCAAEPWWCALLRGYSLATKLARMRMPGASSLPWLRVDADYQEGLAAAPDEVRCRLTDLSELLEPALRSQYVRMPCAARDSVNARVWWLADPLWSVPGNDRLAEQMTRTVLIQLKTALSHDERFDWQVASGSDARVEVVKRYGWPAFVYWGGQHRDSVMNMHLSLKGSPLNPPYATYEYSQGRVHLLPNRHALETPLAADAADWQLYAPPGGDTIIHFKIEETYRITDLSSEAMSKHARNARQQSYWLREGYPSYVQNTLWWPVEHYAAPRSLVQLPIPQVAFLRRQNHAIVATSVALNSAIGRPAGATIDSITLVVTPRPEFFAFPATARGMVGSPAVLVGNIPSEKSLLGIEFASGEYSLPAGRTRFGITPPPTLAQMSAKDRAISDVVLLVPAGGSDALPSTTEGALALMAPTDTVRRGSSIGLYWESYGYASGDTVTIEVRIQRTSGQSALRALGRAVGVAGSLNDPVFLRWTESDAAGAGRMVLDGPVVIVGRTVRMNTTRLSAGDYTIEVAMQGRGDAATRSFKQIVVR